MQKFENQEAAFASQNYNPEAVTITGVPAQHIEALKRLANILVVTDAVNPEFQPDYSNDDQEKWENVYLPGSPSGGGFRFHTAAYWLSNSDVGARLVSESDDAAEHVNELCFEDYKAWMTYQRNIK